MRKNSKPRTELIVTKEMHWISLAACVVGVLAIGSLSGKNQRLRDIQKLLAVKRRPSDPRAGRNGPGR
jgi:hypothetical protein